MDKKLKRSSNKMIAGVCGGIAEYYGWEPTMTRLGYVLLTFFTGIFPLLIFYIIAALVMPNE